MTACQQANQGTDRQIPNPKLAWEPIQLVTTEQHGGDAQNQHERYYRKETKHKPAECRQVFHMRDNAQPSKEL
jgi:hypothetical protein